jgi:hypothetical protein
MCLTVWDLLLNALSDKLLAFSRRWLRVVFGRWSMCARIHCGVVVVVQELEKKVKVAGAGAGSSSEA